MGREPRPQLTFHQGIVIAWDAVAGTNTVRVLGRDMNDLPSLIGSEVGLIRADDIVGLLFFQNTYFVLGRIETPGVAQRAFGVVSQRVAASVFTSSSSFVALAGGPSVSVEIGSSRRCRVDLSAFVSAFSGVAYAGFEVSGASQIGATNRWALAAGGSSPSGQIEVTSSATKSINLSAADGLKEGLNVFTMRYQLLGDPPGQTSEFSDREISVQPY